jgi:acyl-CoA oxidase
MNNDPAGPAATGHRDEFIEIVHDGHYHTTVGPLQDLFDHELFVRRDGLTSDERARLGYRQLRHIGGQLGPATKVTTDRPTLFALFEGAATHAPEMCPPLSGHYNLVAGTLNTLGGGRQDLQPYIAELDDLRAVGVFVLTELGCGSDVRHTATVARYDRATEAFVLTTPHPGATKFMPNVGLADIAKIAVVAARLHADGHDFGVFPFLLRLRDADGRLAPGVSVQKLPDKPFLAMDNAAISFSDVRLPRASLLHAGLGEFAADGSFTSFCSPSSALAGTLEHLRLARVTLGLASLAATRASLAIALAYARNRLISIDAGPPVPMLRLRHVQRGLLCGLARAYALTFLANAIKRQLCRPDTDAGELALLGMLAKPLFSWSALEIIQECRERCGAQGMFSVNRIADYPGLCQAAITAEGDNQVLHLAAGRMLLVGRGYAARSGPEITTPPTDLTAPEAWLSLLGTREMRLRDRIKTALRSGVTDNRNHFNRLNDQMVPTLDLVDSYGHRRALEELLAAAMTSAHHRDLLTRVAHAFALYRLNRHCGWYLAEGLLTAQQVSTLDARLATACASLCRRVPELVDGMGVRTDILAAPAASDDYVGAWTRGTAPAPMA